MERLNSEYVRGEIADSILVKTRLLEDSGVIAVITRVAELWLETLQRGNRIYFAGNGGSAADAQHLAGELVSRFAFDRPGLAGVALSTDTSILTAVGNDYGYDQVYRRQVEALGVEGDLLVAISTSGNSPNLIEALRAARARNMITIGLSGADGGAMRAHCDYCIRVPSASTPRIQESHIVIGHTLCGLVEAAIFGAQDEASSGTGRRSGDAAA